MNLFFSLILSDAPFNWFLDKQNREKSISLHNFSESILITHSIIDYIYIRYR